MFSTPERPLDPPEGRATGGHEWLASFTCRIGDEGMKVQITAEVTRDDELDPESIYALFMFSRQGLVFTPINVSDMLNEGHRKQITAHFDAHFDEIYGACHD